MANSSNKNYQSDSSPSSLPIGGYFSLELPWHMEYHSQAIRLNTGRNALEYILKHKSYKRIYLPYYICEVVIEPLHRLGIDYVFYHINTNFELAEDILLGKDEALLYVNYYGLKQTYIEQIAAYYGSQLIVDNTQAFYDRPINGIDTFYTCRKFFGVPDGAYAYTHLGNDSELDQDVSYNRMEFLCKRIDLSPEAGYRDFRLESAALAEQPVRRMSRLTQRLMLSIDYETAAQRRRANYTVLDQSLSNTNRLHFPLSDNDVPMIYPYLPSDENLHDFLISHKIYVAHYWPCVMQWCTINDIEYMLARDMVPIPCDQRYNSNDMQHIINLIHQWKSI
ncbi:MAG: hypothetical protein IKX33_04805 [Prevotella sp.]|nr:hypothetical protein [Prevotella sp.]